MMNRVFESWAGVLAAFGGGVAISYPLRGFLDWGYNLALSVIPLWILSAAVAWCIVNWVLRRSSVRGPAAIGASVMIGGICAILVHSAAYAGFVVGTFLDSSSLGVASVAFYAAPIALAVGLTRAIGWPRKPA
jgi:hypothetical protein